MRLITFGKWRALLLFKASSLPMGIFLQSSPEQEVAYLGCILMIDRRSEQRHAAAVCIMSNPAANRARCLDFAAA